MADLVFPFRFHSAFAAAALPFGVRAGNSRVTVADEALSIDYGPWHITTPLSNVEAAVLSGPYAWRKVIGPPHLSMKDRGLTFASNPDQGVCIQFIESIRGLDPFGLVKNTAITVTVEQAPALVELFDRSTHDKTRDHTDTAFPTTDELIQEAGDELESMTASQLRDRARQRGIKHASRMNKSELVDALTAPIVDLTDSSEPDSAAM